MDNFEKRDEKCFEPCGREKVDTENFKFFTHHQCEYFPCHNEIPADKFNCLFCYCPLYLLNDKCGGVFSYTKSGRKDCSRCLLPHNVDNFDYIMQKLNTASESMGTSELGRE